MSFGSRLLPALALSTLVATSAGAVVPLQMTVMVNPAAATSTSVAVNRLAANGSTTSSVVTLPISLLNIGQFDPAMGILLGATVKVDNVATAVNSRVQATLANSGAGRFATSTITLNGSVSGTGFAAISNASAVAARTCTNVSPACSQAISAATTVVGPTLAGSAAVSAASLAAYYGVGTVALNRSASGTAQIQNGLRATNGTATGTYGMSGGSYGITYDYINFASPSFDAGFPTLSSVLDFGIINPNNGPVTLNFSLSNIGDDNSAGLSLVSVTRDLNTSAFTSDVATFVNLAGGGSNGFSVTFAPTQRGAFTDRFRFVLADYVPAGAVGGQTYALDLRVMGATIPEPATWATLMIGFGMVGVAVRARRKQKISA